MKYTLYLIVFFIITLSSCNNGNSNKQLAALSPEIVTDSLPTRRQLRRNFFEKRELLILYAANDKQIQSKYPALLDQISNAPQRGRFRLNITYKLASEITKEDIKTKVLLLIGTSESNPIIAQLSANSLPISFSKSKMMFNKRSYAKASDVLSLMFYPNPKNTTLPFSFITGNDDAEIFKFLTHRINKSGARALVFNNMNYEIYRNNTKVLMGNFDDRWVIDSKVYFDYSSGNDTISKSKHYNFISHQNAISETKISKLINDIEQTTTSLLEFVNTKITLPKINYHIYKTAEDKGLMLGNTEQAHFNIETNSVHTIINAKYQDNFIQKEHHLILKQILGNSKSLTLERGLPVYFTNQWQHEGYKYWAGRLAKSNNALSLTELFDNQLIQNESGLVTDCMSASLVDFLIQHFGKEVFLKKYNNWVPTLQELTRLEIPWKQYLKRLASTVTIPNKRSNTNYLKGFNFAHEGYGIYNGYASRKATEALVKQKNMGSNAITIVPYSYIRNGDDIEPTYLSLNKGAGSENDQGVIHSAYEAKQLGMSTLLKPQVFVGRGWAGDMEFNTEEKWQSFFNFYYRWIRHYAFLAEIHNMDMLSVGVEFSKATLTHESNWTQMIKNLKGFYTGQMTYCANWGEEFETISLWKDLDFIGINSYYPLSDKNDATDAELKATFETVKTKIKSVYEIHKKPIVFTEIGFRSINAPWKLPYSDGDNTIFNEDHQDRAYKVIFEGIKNQEWCNGILWWKFPSYLEYRNIENTAFTPNNKKAEQTVKEWFTGVTIN